MNTLNTPARPRASSTTALHRARALRVASVALLLGGAAFGALAQYKIVGPDGSVTYTDKPPVGSEVKLNDGSAAASPETGSLPVATRTAMGKYPVTLYAAKNCPPCDSARQWLRTRGVPYTEYSLDNANSAATFQQRFSTTTMPVVTIGGQTLTGFSPNDMQSYADAAGYPAQATLTHYSWPVAVPLAPDTTTAPVAVAPKPVAPSPAATTAPTSSNGIQF